jgi:hypothetical protein
MKLVNNTKDPDLLGVECSDQDWQDINRIVNNINQDLIDSGYEQYQVRVELQDNSIYIKPN